MAIRWMIPLALAAAALAAEPPKFRLGDEVRPLRYAVDLKLVPEQDTFSGKVAIDLELRQPAQTLWLHGRKIKVASAALETPAGSLPAKPVAAAEGDFLGFELPSPVPPGKARLVVEYEGEVNAKASNGIFKNKDKDDWYIFTQLESIEARSAFPCFDEPRFKTPWQLTLHVRKEHSAFSNTPALSETEEADGFKTVKFAATRPLPSYLVAFAVGPFEVVDAGKAGRKQTPLRIIVPQGRSGEAKWAVESTGQVLTLLENYFNVPYPFEKLDSVAVPLFGGAMENPGLITYGMSLILGRPENDPINRRRAYVSVAAHEIAHMWFGDLVTMRWWDDLWLNESFATWMGDKITARYKPEWDWTTTMTSSRLGAMNADSLVTARKIHQPVESRHDIANAFDGITYGKGGAVLHTFEHWIGPEVFRKGVKTYLDSHVWGNATSADFLRALSTAAGRDIAPAFSSYLDQAGVPVVSVELKCERGKPPVLALAQKRYLPMGSQAPAAQTWRIPVCYEYGTGTKSRRACTLLAEASAEAPIQGAACPDWVLLNDEYAGYYRTHYRGDLLNRLLAVSGRLSASERLGVIRDVEALVRSGELLPGEALRLAPKFASDPNRHVVNSAVAIAASVHAHLVPDELRANYARFIQKTFGPRAHELGWAAKPGEPEDTKLLRQTLLWLVAGPGEDAELRRQAAELGRKWLDDRRAVEPELTAAALSLAAREGDAALWERMLAEAKKTRDERERSSLLAAMGSFRNPEIIERNFDVMLRGDFDMRQSLELLFTPLQHPETRAIPYQYVKAHYDAIAAKAPGGLGLDFRAFLPYVAGGFCSLDQAAEVEEFFKERSAKSTGGPRILSQVLEQVRQCSVRRLAQQGAVAEFLKAY